jgi:hypothetical protein
MPMAHFLFDSRPDAAEAPDRREAVAARLRLKIWAVSAAEPHRDRLATGDHVLIYLGKPEREFVGQAVLASAVRDWVPSEALAYSGTSESGVSLANVEAWDPPVPMDAVVQRVDPAGTNPYVQRNARAGFQNGVVEITAGEYDAVLAVRAERLARGTTGH